MTSRKTPAPTPASTPAARSRLLAPAVLAVASVVVAAIIALAVIFVFGHVEFPAFTSSNVLFAITVVAQVVALAAIVAGAWLARRGESGTALGKMGPAASTRVGKLLLPAANALLVAATLAIPLSATRLYLMGVSVDQEFRSQFLGRSATSAGLPDMAYADMPSFYPSGWFWFGGRFANVLGMDGWEAYKPWAIVSLATVAALAMVLWTRLLRTDIGAAAATVTTLIMLAHGSHEPYGAVVALLAPPMLLLAWHAVAPTQGARSASGAQTPTHDVGGAGRFAVAATLVFLGISACFYTLYTGWAALTVVLMALVSAGLARWGRTPRGYGAGLPIVRLVIIGVGSMIVALLAWAPYLWAALTGSTAASGLANHYLPPEGAQFPLPMLDTDPAGLLCLAGVVWLALRAGTSRRAAALGLGLAGAYAWVGLSLLASVVGTTLLSFRMDLIISMLLAVAGVFGAFELAGALSKLRIGSTPGVRAVAALAAVSAIGAVAYAQHIPTQLEPELTHAYEDTDGNGERGDRQDADKAGYYPEIDEFLQSELGQAPEDIVVESGAPGFFAVTDYLAYQAVTTHYANPLAHFGERSAVIESWADAETPEELHEAITDTEWRAPDALVAERKGNDYTLRLSRDVFPSDPNVEFFTVTIDAEAVDGDQFTTTDIGPFTVIEVN